ncbi:MAG: hypothetical protein BVN29_10110 [Nitrospira sp. ST-bin5]|nr:MAG: hypothetical protein BVN29_10110 [Nitrospira sp. ST-bin5]
MKLKLAMVTAFPQTPGLQTGGIETVAFNLADRLSSLTEIEVHIVAPTNIHMPSPERRGQLTIHWISNSRLPGFLDYWTIFRWRTHRLLRIINPDITHFQGLAGWTLGYSKPHVLTIHGIAEEDVMYKGGPFLKLRRHILAQIERQGRKRTPHVIIINPYVVTQIGDQLVGTLWEIENPIAEEFFSVTASQLSPRILYIGRISSLKNIEGLLRSFALVHITNSSATLRLAGAPETSEYMQKCTNLIEELGIRSSVSFLGSLKRAALLSELEQARCLVLVTKQENSPMVIAEAMAAGVPVIASRICGIPHMVKDGETGFLVDPGNVQEIATKLKLFLDNPLLAKKMGQLSKTVAATRFHSSKVAESTLAVYKNILSASGINM